MVEAAAEATEELMNKYLETGDLSEEEIKLADPSAHHRDRDPAHALRHRLQEQGRATHARRRHRLLPSPLDIPPVSARTKTTSRSLASALTKRSSRPSRSKLMTDPYVGQLTFVRVLGRVAVWRDRLQPDPRQEGAHRPILQMHANQREEIPLGNSGWRHRCLRGPEGRDDRRNAVIRTHHHA